MQISAISIDDYISKIPEERQEVFKEIFDVIHDNLPKGFSENISYGMVGWAVPLETYPPGYHCSPGAPLPFIGLASQKNFIALYHMGIYDIPLELIAELSKKMTVDEWIETYEKNYKK